MKSINYDDGWALFNSGKYEEAVPLLRAAAEALESAENWNDLGACEFKANLPQAEASFRHALALDPSYSLARLNLGVLLARKNRYPEALPLLEKVRHHLTPAEQASVDELLRSCRAAVASPSAKPSNSSVNPPVSMGRDRPGILFLVLNFGANGFSDANASEAWMLCSALRASRPEWDVEFVSLEHEATQRTSDAERRMELLPFDEAAAHISNVSPSLLHIVYPWLKVVPESLLETHPAIITLTGADPTEHCTPRDLETIRHLIDFGRLSLVCESEGAREILRQRDIKVRAMIPPVLPAPSEKLAALGSTVRSRDNVVCGFATSPYLDEHWETRGVPLLLDLARLSPDTHFLLAWRTSTEKIEQSIAGRGLKNVSVRAGRLDMGSFYADVDIVALPFARGWGNHGSPLSGVEGLLRGKPVLATEFVGIAGWLRDEGAGVVTAPTATALRAGLQQIASHYSAYSNQARSAARRRFNSAANAAAYETLYAEMLEAHKGPTLAEWESDARRGGRELVRGREALANYYLRPDVATSYIANRFLAPPFDQLNAQELQAIPKLIQQKFGVRTDLRLLDFASGTGRLVPALLPFGSVTVFDGSAAMLAAREQAVVGVRCITGDVFHTPIGERFHMLTCGRFLRHFEYPDRKLIYRRFRELLRCDGLAIVDVPDPQFEQGFRDRSGWENFLVYDVFWTLSSFRDELRENGFQLAGFAPIGVNVQLYDAQPHLDEGCYYLVSFELSP